MTDDLDALVRQGRLTPSQASEQRQKLEAKFQKRIGRPGTGGSGFLSDSELSPLYDEIVSREMRETMQSTPAECPEHSAGKHSKKQRSKPARQRAADALAQIWPDGIPKEGAPDFVTNDDLFNEVDKYLTAKKKRTVSKDTVLRAAGRRSDDKA